MVVLIHGTTHSNFLSVSLGGETDWIEPDRAGLFASEFRNAFLEADSTADLSIIPFHWDGDNSNPARHEAGVALAAALDKIPRNVEVYVIGHSHGGNVALQALTHSSRDANAVVLLGTPYLGVSMTRQRAGDTYTLPLYLPLPDEAPETEILSLYSPVDSVATFWADLCPGTTFDDLDATNAEAWRRAFRLDKSAVPLTLNKKQRRRRREAGLDPNTAMRNDVAVYDFDGGDGVVSQVIPAELGLHVANVSVPADTILNLPRKWVHSALHSPQVGRALGHCLAARDTKELAKRIGTLRN